MIRYSQSLPHRYTGERIMRVMRGTRPVMIKRVKYIPPVLELHLEPVGNWFKFKEGQYLYLNIPHIDPNLGELFSSWHPFTISSAMGDLKEKTEKDRFVSLHIKVWPGGWTEKLKNYLELMNPNDSYPMTFTRRDEYVVFEREAREYHFYHLNTHSHRLRYPSVHNKITRIHFVTHTSNTGTVHKSWAKSWVRTTNP